MALESFIDDYRKVNWGFFFFFLGCGNISFD